MENHAKKHKMKFARQDYYQGILQLRGINEEVLAFVNSQIKKRGDVAATRAVSVGDGIDLYITSQKFIRMLGKKLVESFGGSLKTSSKLHTRNRQGRDLYRVNVLFRLHRHKAGDIVMVRGDRFRLLHVGRKIFARNLKTGKKATLRAQDLN